MGTHTFDPSKADRLERAADRYRYCSREELLGALGCSPNDVVADLGSGTGFYTDDVAPHAETVLAIDSQDAMHAYYRSKGVPSNVELITADVCRLPLAEDALDGAFSTMTYHEFASEAALQELHRVLERGSRLVVVDWAGSGTGDAGPPLSERYELAQTSAALEGAGFRIAHETGRPETFLIVGTVS